MCTSWKGVSGAVRPGTTARCALQGGKRAWHCTYLICTWAPALHCGVPSKSRAMQNKCLGSGYWFSVGCTWQDNPLLEDPVWTHSYLTCSLAFLVKQGGERQGDPGRNGDRSKLPTTVRGLLPDSSKSKGCSCPGHSRTSSTRSRPEELWSDTQAEVCSINHLYRPLC